MFKEYVVMLGMDRNCRPDCIAEVEVINGDYTHAYNQAYNKIKKHGNLLCDYKIVKVKEDF